MRLTGWASGMRPPVARGQDQPARCRGEAGCHPHIAKLRPGSLPEKGRGKSCHGCMGQLGRPPGNKSADNTGAQPSWRFKCPGAGQGPGGLITSLALTFHLKQPLKSFSEIIVTLKSCAHRLGKRARRACRPASATQDAHVQHVGIPSPRTPKALPAPPPANLDCKHDQPASVRPQSSG